ncbi:MAG: hypothetical protein FWF59_05585 [Turicibacter sp.]|nr:hypothetical protein [Turicibacter sp.]
MNNAFEALPKEEVLKDWTLTLRSLDSLNANTQLNLDLAFSEKDTEWVKTATDKLVSAIKLKSRILGDLDNLKANHTAHDFGWTAEEYGILEVAFLELQGDLLDLKEQYLWESGQEAKLSTIEEIVLDTTVLQSRFDEVRQHPAVS